MSEMFQTERALRDAATKVEATHGDVTQRCQKLTGEVQQMMSGWGGQGATSFNNLMFAWQDKQKTIMDALEMLRQALVETDKDNVSTDEAQSAASANLAGRLG